MTPLSYQLNDDFDIVLESGAYHMQCSTITTDTITTDNITTHSNNCSGGSMGSVVTAPATADSTSTCAASDMEKHNTTAPEYIEHWTHNRKTADLGRDTHAGGLKLFSGGALASTYEMLQHELDTSEPENNCFDINEWDLFGD
jgi:hypothetical protein